MSSKLKALTHKIAAEVMGDGPGDAYIQLLAERAEETIEYERKSMPKAFGYTRERSLIGRCRSACGGYLPGAVLVHHVLHRFSKNASGLVELKGKHWICQTREWWCYELGLTRHEYDRALSVAKTKQLLDVDHAKLTPKGLPMTLIRPADRALVLRISLIAAVKEAKTGKAMLEHQCGTNAP